MVLKGLDERRGAAVEAYMVKGREQEGSNGNGFDGS